MITIPPICPGCSHYRPGTRQTCDAFPGGIPDDIILNRFDHRQPHAFDLGIRFDPRTPEDAVLADHTFALLAP